MRTLLTAAVVAGAVLAAAGAEAVVQVAIVTPVGTSTNCHPVDRNGVQTDGVCDEVDVTCGGIGARRASIITRRPVVQPSGNIIFFTGELSRARYSEHEVRRERILEPLLSNGFTTFEVYFEGWDYENTHIAGNPNPDFPGVATAPRTDGVFHGANGAGIDFACAGEAVMRYIAATYVTDNPDYVCAAGNSNGGELIAAALTLYSAEDYLKSAVISAGPPMAQFYEACGPQGSGVPHSRRDHVTDRLGAHSPMGAPNGGFSPMELID